MMTRLEVACDMLRRVEWANSGNLEILEALVRHLAANRVTEAFREDPFFGVPLTAHNRSHGWKRFIGTYATEMEAKAVCDHHNHKVQTQ